MINRRNIIERFLLSSKAIVDKNLNYVSLDGNCPDERLLETGKFKIGKTKPFEIKK